MKCYTHPERDAQATCSYCGKAVCWDCIIPARGGKNYCSIDCKFKKKLKVVGFMSYFILAPTFIFTMVFVIPKSGQRGWWPRNVGISDDTIGVIFICGLIVGVMGILLLIAFNIQRSKEEKQWKEKHPPSA